MELYNTQKQIDAACVALHASAQTVQTEMHKVAVSVLVHYAKNNDKRVVLKLIQAMPESARVNSLREWFNKFGTMTIGAKDEIVTAPGKKLQLADAIKTPFWKFSPEKDYVPMDVSESIKALVKKLETDAKKTARDHSAQINALTSLASTIAAPAAELTKPQAIKLENALPGSILPELAPIPA